MPFEPLRVRLTGEPSSERFVVLHLPDRSQAPAALIIHAPAFAEEMNKARRMVALQARALAAEGFAVLIPDLLGCGDSPGEFSRATWNGWVEDIVGGVRWMATEHARRWPGRPRPPTVLWGLRTGAMLACAAARRLDEVCALALWNPVLQGRTSLQQFLRLVTASEIVGGRAPAGGASARATLAAGRTLEVAGYPLAPALAEGLEAATLSLPDRPHAIAAFEVSPRESASVSPALAAASESWRRQGWSVHVEAVRGPSFWQTTEIEDAPALVTATAAQMSRWCGAAQSSPVTETA